MENQCLAKSNPEKTIKEHTQDLLNQLEILKTIYPSILEKEEWELLDYAAKYHDIGKINTKFQNKLYQKLKKKLLEDNIKEEIPHNFLSPHLINIDKMEEKFGRKNTRILISSVYYHHTREKREVTEEVLEDLRKQKEALGSFFDLDLSQVEDSIGRYILGEKDEEILKERRYILIKGILNKLDYVASLDREGVNVEETCRDNGQTVSDKIKEITKTKYQNNYREVQKYMMEKQEENLVVISYTGSGKTEAALLWIGEQKAFYTLPLKVSINAMYQRIINRIQYKKALLLHGDAYSYYQEQPDIDINSYDRARRLSSPLIITTVDQLFKIAFRYQGYEEILATLSYSRVILDEIQMYSPKMLAYILLGLKMITEVGGKFAIITATFPPLLYTMMDKLEIPYKKQEKEFTSHIANRHKIQVLEQNEFDLKRVQELGKDKKVLIIINTVKRAQELYQKIENAHLLHSHYTKNDRNEIEKQILEFGDREKNKKFGIWISTQIVEASLDIDFDVLFTEMCSIDSLFQRMGRIYRKRNFDQEEPNIYILDNQNGVPYIIDAEIYNYSIEQIKNYNNENLTEENKQEMINNIFDLAKNPELKESKYYKTIKEEISLLKDIIPNELPKKLIDDKFRDIQNINLMPDEIFNQLEAEGKIEEWIETLKNKNIPVSKKIEIKNQIKNYVIGVRYNQKVSYDKEELFYKGSNIYRTPYEYDFNKETLQGKGLIMENMKQSGYFDE